MLCLKVIFNKEIHLLTKEANYSELMKFIRESFKNIPHNFQITYRDAEEDNISISNDEDVHTLYATSTEKVVKITIVPIEESIPAKTEAQVEIKEDIKPLEKMEIVEQDKKMQISSNTLFTESKQIVPEVKIEEPKIVEAPVIQPVREVPPILAAEQVKESKQEVPQQKKEPCLAPSGNECRGKLFSGLGRGAYHQPPTVFPLGAQGVPRPGPDGFSFPGKEFFKQKLEQMINKRIDELLPCIVNKVRLQLQGKADSAPVALDTVVHKGVKCDGCAKAPITGIRYKCYECSDFDFCEECEAKIPHPHNFIKIKNSVEGSPRKMFKKRSPEGEHHRGQGDRGGHHGGHPRGPLAEFGPVAKNAFKLSKWFGGDPEIYREIVEKNADKGFHELKEIYIQEHNIKDKGFVEKLPEDSLEEKIMKKCQKLAFIFREPAQNFVDFVKSNPEMKAWELVELKRGSKCQKKKESAAKEGKPEENITDVYKKVEEPAKSEEKKIEEVKPAYEEPQPINVEAPKSEPILKFKNQFDEKEVDSKLKNEIIAQMKLVAGQENDYTDFVRKNYKQRTDHCLNAWFESQN